MVPPAPVDEATLIEDDVIKLVASGAADVSDVGASEDDVGSVETIDVLDGSVVVDGGTVTTVVDVIDCEVDVDVDDCVETEDEDDEVRAVVDEAAVD